MFVLYRQTRFIQQYLLHIYERILQPCSYCLKFGISKAGNGFSLKMIFVVHVKKVLAIFYRFTCFHFVKCCPPCFTAGNGYQKRKTLRHFVANRNNVT